MVYRCTTVLLLLFFLSTFLFAQGSKVETGRQQSESSRRIHISERVAQAHLRKIVAPIPPGDLVLKGNAVVCLNAVIAKDGSVSQLRMISGHPMLVSAAIEAARQWRYRPFLVQGKPAEVETRISVDFLPTR